MPGPYDPYRTCITQASPFVEFHRYLQWDIVHTPVCTARSIHSKKHTSSSTTPLKPPPNDPPHPAQLPPPIHHSTSAKTIGPATSSLFSLPANNSTTVNAHDIAVPGLPSLAITPPHFPRKTPNSPSTRHHLPPHHNPLLAILPPLPLHLPPHTRMTRNHHLLPAMFPLTRYQRRCTRADGTHVFSCGAEVVNQF